MHELNRALAQALGLPKHTKKAVLTLEAGEYPTLELTMVVTDAAGQPIGDQVKQPVGSYAAALATVQFMVRLVPFPKEGAPT